MKINVVYAMPEISDAYNKDYDGFTAAIEYLSKFHEVTLLNVHPYNSDSKDNAKKIPDADFVLVRSDWGWYPAVAANRHLKGSSKPVGLLIAGSTLPPNKWETQRYDILFYETPWYEQHIKDRHPFAVEAFGVDKRYMNEIGAHERDIDYLFVGRLASFKRPLKLVEKNGYRVALGDFASADKSVLEALKESGVILEGQKTYQELASYYKRAKNVLVPCELQGGGERAVLEGRACGANVEVMPDNPKLISLLDIDIKDHVHYGNTLKDGIEKVVVQGVRVPAWKKKVGFLVFFNKYLFAKIKRSPNTLKMRLKNIL